MRRAIVIALFGGLISVLPVKQASARKPYFDEFKEKYATDKDYLAEVEKASCFVCHVGKSKKNRNAYGMALGKVIAKGEKDKAKIGEALGKIEDEKSSDGKTFGELIKEHKLPGGEPKRED
ncbi:MAG TPA: hypothetical protein VHC22_26795 [Pirellulales bacterium]|nr:hypothetical protein [Pirellulales bacterium]